MASTLKTVDGVREWLKTAPSLAELQAKFPKEWDQARAQLLAASANGTMPSLISSLSGRATPTRDRKKSDREEIAQLVRSQMILRALKSAGLRAESGVEEGPVKFSPADGWVLQKLFFARDLVRKPVSLLAYSIIWPLARQRRRLLPLVRPAGIYCFYSAALIRQIARLAEGRPVLEIAAGDGTLSRFLRDAGVEATATDDYSWSSAITYGDDVEKADAATAMRKHAPSVVLCSWPPPNNPFEKKVFTTDSVQRYIVITSANQPDASDWKAYAEQGDFEVVEDGRLGRLVLPRGSSRVLVFTRKSAASSPRR